MKFITLSLLALSLFCVASWGAAPPTPPLTITYKDAGKTYFVETGDTVIVDLYSQPGTGQFWCLKKVEGKAIKLDRFILEALDKEEGIKLGGRARIQFRFKAKERGISELKFMLTKAGKKQVEIEGMEVTIKVKK